MTLIMSVSLVVKCVVILYVNDSGDSGDAFPCTGGNSDAVYVHEKNLDVFLLHHIYIFFLC